MKFVLREKKTLREDKNQNAVLVSVDPKFFLQLTTGDDFENIMARAERYGEYNPEKAGSSAILLKLKFKD